MRVCFAVAPLVVPVVACSASGQYCTRLGSYDLTDVEALPTYGQPTSCQ